MVGRRQLRSNDRAPKVSDSRQAIKFQNDDDDWVRGRGHEERMMHT